MNELFRKILFLPEQASTFAAQIDRLHYFVISVTLFSSVLVGVIAVYFMFRYRRTREREVTPHIEPTWWFEAACIGVPLGFFLLWFAVGFRDFIIMDTPPAKAMDVYVMGKQWMWKFAYPNGPSGVGVLHVPAGRPVRLLMTSRDVLHSFFVPAFRIKKDVLPGRYTQLWFEAKEPGRHQIFCAEMCGVNHSTMLGEVVVHAPQEFDAWLERETRGSKVRGDMSAVPGELPPPLADMAVQGERLAGKYGCLKCHSVDGSQHIGPSWLDMYLRKETLKTGQVVVADEGYITESMMDPLAKVVAGYAPVMPTYQGRLSGPEAAAILEYIKSLRSDRILPLPAKEPIYYEPNQPPVTPSGRRGGSRP
jgi:cytochrome c oxidase subunit II